MRRRWALLLLLLLPCGEGFTGGMKFCTQRSVLSLERSGVVSQRRCRSRPFMHVIGGHHHHHNHGAGAAAIPVEGMVAPKLPPLGKRAKVARVICAVAVVLALPLWRRSNRVEIAIVGLLAGFLGCVEAGKVLMRRMRLSPLYQMWATHVTAAAEGTVTERDRLIAAEQDKVTWTGVACNVALASFKLFAGIAGHSSAMIADAGHSLSDLLSDGVTLWALKISRLPPDSCHPYGHGKFEGIGALAVGLMLLATGYGIGALAYETLAKGPAILLPTRVAALAAAVSIVSKEALYQVTAAVGKRQNSQVLIANAWHHRSDAVSSIVALLAIVGAMMGAPMLDPLAGLMVAGMVSLSGLQVVYDSTQQLTDTADLGMRKKVADVAKAVDGVLSYDKVRCRQMGPQTLVDLTIRTDPTISVSAGQQVAQRVRWEILQQLPSVADVMVNLSIEDKVCPACVELRSHEEIESDIRRVLKAEVEEVIDVPRVLVHYIAMTVRAEVFIRVQPRLRVHEAVEVARRAKKALRIGIKDLCSTEVHLDLVETY